jgi:dTDP-4-amino-4,6-dideoxygalactose transaminase
MPAHRQPPYAAAHATADLPVTEAAADDVLSLPTYPEPGEEQVARVCGLVREFFCPR